jgi:hypothetical protein
VASHLFLVLRLGMRYKRNNKGNLYNAANFEINFHYQTRTNKKKDGQTP